MNPQLVMHPRAVAARPSGAFSRRGRHRRPSPTALASQRLLAGAALGSVITLGTATVPAFAASHGATQGASQSDPDGVENGGADKPGGTGGVSKADQDGNNGSGNDSDCEDDNNGMGTPGSCDAHERNAARSAQRSQESSSAEAGESTRATVGSDARATAHAAQSARGATAAGGALPAGATNAPAAPAPTGGTVAGTTPAAQVLGTRFVRTPAEVAASSVPAAATSTAGVSASSGMTEVAGVSAGLLPHTGTDVGAVTKVGTLGVASLLLGGALLAAGRHRRRDHAGIGSAGETQ